MIQKISIGEMAVDGVSWTKTNDRAAESAKVHSLQKKHMVVEGRIRTKYF